MMLKKVLGTMLLLLIAGVLLCASLSCGGEPAEEVHIDDTVEHNGIDFPDPRLEAAIREALGNPAGPINASDLEGLTQLLGRSWGITELTGIEYCSNLETLDLYDEGPRICYWEGSELKSNDNNVSDISPLSGLVSLKELNLGHNNVSDITPLSVLTNLEELVLSGNNIGDISPLLNLDSLQMVDVTDNPIAVYSNREYISELQSRGVTVQYSCYVPDPVLAEAMNGISLAHLGNLTYLETWGVKDLTGIECCTNLTSLYLTWCNISDFSPLAGLTNLEVLYLCHFEVKISNVSFLSELSDMRELYLTDNEVSDIRPLADLTNLTLLDLSKNQISDISPLARLRKLQGLRLDENQIQNISPLAGLNSLTELFLGRNQISSISGLSGLTNLGWLFLSGNQIEDISPLAGLSNLNTLGLGGNEISDISPLWGLKNLEHLSLRQNQIINIAPLRGLKNLTILSLSGNQISDLSPISGLTGLTSLRIYDNNINSISPLSGLVNLEALHLWDNQISDIATLSGLTNLRYLAMWDNQISDLKPLVDNTGLSKGSKVEVQDNPLSNASIETYIPELESRGVEVLYTPEDEYNMAQSWIRHVVWEYMEGEAGLRPPYGEIINTSECKVDIPPYPQGEWTYGGYVLDFCYLLGYTGYRDSDFFPFELPICCYGQSGEEGTNFYTGNCSNPYNGHYVWLVDDEGWVCSVCVGDDCWANNESGYQGVWP
jgi:internalin A